MHRIINIVTVKLYISIAISHSLIVTDGDRKNFTQSLNSSSFYKYGCRIVNDVFKNLISFLRDCSEGRVLFVPLTHLITGLVVDEKSHVPALVRKN